MKLIIDMPEEVVTAIQNGEDYRYDIHTAIAQGIPYEENPKGKWIIQSTGDGTNYFVCSKCHKAGDGWDSFCRRCGSDNREVNNG